MDLGDLQVTIKVGPAIEIDEEGLERAKQELVARMIEQLEVQIAAAVGVAAAAAGSAAAGMVQAMQAMAAAQGRLEEAQRAQALTCVDERGLFGWPEYERAKEALRWFWCCWGIPWPPAPPPRPPRPEPRAPRCRQLAHQVSRRRIWLPAGRRG